MERAKSFLPFMILQMRDEDLEKLEQDENYPTKEEADKVLLTMILNPKEKWKELGVPSYLMKYEFVDEDDEE